MDTVAYVTDDPSAEEVRLLIQQVVNDLGAVLTSPDVATAPTTYWETLRESGAVVAYLKHGKPNAIYELGVATGLGKPIVLLVRDASVLPFDLRALPSVKLPQEPFAKVSEKEQLYFNLEAKVSAALEGRFSDRGLQLGGDADVPRRADKPAPFTFDSILRRPLPRRGRLLEEWFADLANGVPHWRVSAQHRLSSESDTGYDLAIWNDRKDPELAALGNPIVVELKSTARLASSLIKSLAARAADQNLQGILVATTAPVSDANRRAVETAFRTYAVITVVLGREDLRLVDSADALVNALRRGLRAFRST